jgi:uncharacterized protein YsxB (DUF464 family)
MAFDKGIRAPLQSRSPVIVSVKGHAGTGPRGFDLVCSAVSALAQTLAISVKTIAGIESPLTAHSGLLVMEIPPGERSAEQELTTRVLLESFFIGAVEIMKEYPSAVKITFN